MSAPSEPPLGPRRPTSVTMTSISETAITRAAIASSLRAATRASWCRCRRRSGRCRRPGGTRNDAIAYSSNEIVNAIRYDEMIAGVISGSVTR